MKDNAMEPIFKRAKENPIIWPRDLPVPAEAVLNPGATVQGDDVVLLLRVENNAGYSDIHVARSRNGVDNWKIEKEPLLRHGMRKWRYERWGCEDPRVVWLDDEQCWYITYTAYSQDGAAVGLARTRDLESAERVGLIFSPNNKDAALFPTKFDGRWAALHRPEAGGGIENIWMAYSRDLIYWGEHHCVLREGAGPTWDAVRVGTGPPPIKVDDGWLLLYHGVKMYGGLPVYRVGVAMLQEETPYKLAARSRSCIFKPEEPYEKAGLIANTVFPTGVLERGDEIWIYYGACDSTVCLATAGRDALLNALE